MSLDVIEKVSFIFIRMTVIWFFLFLQKKKVKYQIKQLNNLNENLFESEECLKILNYIDKSYTDKANQIRIAEILAECNYPGKINIKFCIKSFWKTNLLNFSVGITQK